MTYPGLQGLYTATDQHQQLLQQHNQQEGDAVPCVPAAGQCYNTTSPHRRWSQTKELTARWHGRSLCESEQRWWGGRGGGGGCI
jgi:hypothetical protein